VVVKHQSREGAAEEQREGRAQSRPEGNHWMIERFEVAPGLAQRLQALELPPSEAAVPAEQVQVARSQVYASSPCLNNHCTCFMFT
jgi:hypothetical protein